MSTSDLKREIKLRKLPPYGSIPMIRERVIRAFIVEAWTLPGGDAEARLASLGLTQTDLAPMKLMEAMVGMIEMLVESCVVKEVYSKTV